MLSQVYITTGTFSGRINVLLIYYDIIPSLFYSWYRNECQGNVKLYPIKNLCRNNSGQQSDRLCTCVQVVGSASGFNEGLLDITCTFNVLRNSTSNGNRKILVTHL